MQFHRKLYISMINIVRYIEYIKKSRFNILIGSNVISTRLCLSFIAAQKNKKKFKTFNNLKTVIDELKKTINKSNDYIFHIKLHKVYCMKYLYKCISIIQKSNIHLIVSTLEIKNMDLIKMYSMFTKNSIFINTNIDLKKDINKLIQAILKLENINVNHDLYHYIYIFSLFNTEKIFDNVNHVIRVKEKSSCSNSNKNRYLKSIIKKNNKTCMKDTISHVIDGQKDNIFLLVKYLSKKDANLDYIIYMFNYELVDQIIHTYLIEKKEMNVFFLRRVYYVNILLKDLLKEESYFNIYNILVSLVKIRK